MDLSGEEDRDEILSRIRARQGNMSADLYRRYGTDPVTWAIEIKGIRQVRV